MKTWPDTVVFRVEIATTAAAMIRTITSASPPIASLDGDFDANETCYTVERVGGIRISESILSQRGANDRPIVAISCCVRSVAVERIVGNKSAGEEGLGLRQCRHVY